MSISSMQPDPSAIGGISKAPFALVPNPARFFKERANRFEGLAPTSRIASYLTFLAAISRLQAEMAVDVAPPRPIEASMRERARDNGMPPIDRNSLSASAELQQIVRQFVLRAQSLEKPVPAAEALAEVQSADDETLVWMIDNVLAHNLPPESLAHHLYVAAAVQLYAAGLASSLDAARLVPVGTGVCPSCGGKPVGSMIIGFQGAEGARYAACSCCATMWNEVRVKCLSCASTKGIGYRAVEASGDGAAAEATVKAEVCDNCNSWTKILYQNKNPSLEIVADDVASLGLDLLMKETDYRRAGFDPFLVGY